MKLRYACHELWIAYVFGGSVIQLSFEVADRHSSGLDPAKHGQTDVTIRINAVRLADNLVHFGALDGDLIVRPQEISRRLDIVCAALNRSSALRASRNGRRRKRLNRRRPLLGTQMDHG